MKTLLRDLSSRKDRGQLMAAVLMLLVIMATLIPIMVMYTMREAKWTVAQSQNTTAFHVAEAASEKAYNALTISTMTWVNLMKGTPPPGYMMDAAYADINGGTYAIGITSGPASQQATVVTVARDSLKKETRAIKVVYVNSPLGNIAILGGNGVTFTGVNMEVEWGAIMSPQSITTGGRLHPQYWSAASIDMDTNGATPPNCDQPNCRQWHSYSQNIPPLPTIDFAFYKSSAQASGAGPGGCGNHYQTTDPGNWNCTDTSGKPYYFDSNLTFNGGHIIGSVIVMGNFDSGNGNLGGGAETVPMPNTAWKQYGNDWAYYLSNYDASPPAPAAFPGLNNTYQSNRTANISPVFHGLLYINGNFIGPNGGGNTDLAYGVVYVKGTVTLNSNSHVKVYYGADAQNALQTTQILLTRTSWQDTIQSWPSGWP